MSRIEQYSPTSVILTILLIAMLPLVWMKTKEDTAIEEKLEQQARVLIVSHIDMINPDGYGHSEALILHFSNSDSVCLIPNSYAPGSPPQDSIGTVRINPPGTRRASIEFFDRDGTMNKNTYYIQSDVLLFSPPK